MSIDKSRYIKKYKRSELPAKVKIDLIKIKKSIDTNKFIGYLFAIVGIAIGVIGGAFIMFGPSTITYNRYEGMTFFQMLQAYPGPVATVGGVILTIGSSVVSVSEAALSKKILEEINKQMDFDISKLPDDEEVTIENVADGSLLVDIQKIEIELSDEESKDGKSDK